MAFLGQLNHCLPLALSVSVSVRTIGPDFHDSTSRLDGLNALTLIVVERRRLNLYAIRSTKLTPNTQIYLKIRCCNLGVRLSGVAIAHKLV